MCSRDPFREKSPMPGFDISHGFLDILLHYWELRFMFNNFRLATEFSEYNAR